MTTHPAGRLEVFFDMTRTVQSRGRMAGAVRVESEFASALMRSHPDAFVPIAWSSSAGHFVELDRGDAVAALSGTGAGGAEAAGRRLDTSRASDPATRRIIVVTGAGWLSNLSLLHGLVGLRRDLGAELHVVVHDLVHMRFPQWAPRDETIKATSAHEAMLSSADRVLVYSDSTARDIAAASAERGLDVNDIGRMTLGTAFVSARAEAAGLEALLDRPFVLYVSSVATRKNHQFIAEVWSRLSDQLGAALPRLLFVGRAASDQREVLDRLRRNPVLEDHLIHVSRASDGQLAWLYEKCLFTVFPSLYEGWGLPVAESLAFGKVCLASNVSSMPEAAGGVTPLLDPLDISAWCAAIGNFVEHPESLRAAQQRVRQGYRPTAWPDAAERLWDAVTAPLAHRGAPRMLMASGAAVAVSALTATCQQWRPLRNPLGLVTAHRARAGILLGELPPHGVRLSLSMRNGAETPVGVETNVNGSVLDNCALEPHGETTRELDMPRDVLVLRGLLDITTTCRGKAAPALTLTTIRAMRLSADEEAASVEARRDSWRLDEPLHFTAGSRHLPLLRDGWDQPAQWGVWSVKARAAIDFRPAPVPLEPMELTAVVRGFVPPQQPSLEVDVCVGDVRVGTWTFTHPADFTFVERRVVIPPELVDDGWIRLRFAMPEARSPRDLGMSQDDRTLGLGLVRLHAAERT